MHYYANRLAIFSFCIIRFLFLYFFLGKKKNTKKKTIDVNLFAATTHYSTNSNFFALLRFWYSNSQLFFGQRKCINFYKQLQNSTESCLWFSIFKSVVRWIVSVEIFCPFIIIKLLYNIDPIRHMWLSHIISVIWSDYSRGQKK